MPPGVEMIDYLVENKEFFELVLPSYENIKEIMRSAMD